MLGCTGAPTLQPSIRSLRVEPVISKIWIWSTLWTIGGGSLRLACGPYPLRQASDSTQRSSGLTSRAATEDTSLLSKRTKLP